MNRMWGAHIYVPPTGLRECVLRIQFLANNQVVVISRSRGSSLLTCVARWRLYEPCKWLELVSLIGCVDVAPKIGAPRKQVA